MVMDKEEYDKAYAAYVRRRADMIAVLVEIVKDEHFMAAQRIAAAELVLRHDSVA